MQYHHHNQMFTVIDSGLDAFSGALSLILILSLTAISQNCLAETEATLIRNGMINRSSNIEEKTFVIKKSETNPVARELSDVFESLKEFNLETPTPDETPESEKPTELTEAAKPAPEYSKLGDAFEFLDQLEVQTNPADKELGDAFQFLDKMEALPSADDRELGDAFEFLEQLESAKVFSIQAKPVLPSTLEKEAAVIVTSTQTPASEKELDDINIPVTITSTATKTDFLKRDLRGNVVNDEASTWSCVEDTENKLIWEVKTADGGLRDSSHAYTWYSPEQNNQQGVADGGRCDGGINCDTYAYQQAMNEQNLCGYTDWRLPTREELQSLVNFEQVTNGPKINASYFPQTEASWYWTASSNENEPDYAWYVLFRNGVPLNDLKERPKHIRLVRDNKPEPTLASIE